MWVRKLSLRLTQSVRSDNSRLKQISLFCIITAGIDRSKFGARLCFNLLIRSKKKTICLADTEGMNSLLVFAGEAAGLQQQAAVQQ